ncbi:MAG TPA: hypothetical protein VK050_00390, partial [Flavobacteriaceae bacterium]|nr:hypothetical protein [Flavobacteriaceae bacterium]
SPTILPNEVIRATEEEKQAQIDTLNKLHKVHEEKSDKALRRIQESAIQNENVFEEIMEASKICSLGQLTNALFEVGGQYRRNM